MVPSNFRERTVPSFDNTISLLNLIPQNRRGALVIRHSVRVPILDRSEVYLAGLTPEGISFALDFGKTVGQLRKISRIITSPVSRCVDTATAIAEGAKWPEKVRINHYLSHAYIEAAWNLLPVCYPHDPVPFQMGNLFATIFDRDDQPGLLDIFITHDTIVQVMAGYFYCEHYDGGNWPNFLEGVGLWLENDQIHMVWRDAERVIPRSLVEGLVVPL